MTFDGRIANVSVRLFAVYIVRGLQTLVSDCSPLLSNSDKKGFA